MQHRRSSGALGLVFFGLAACTGSVAPGPEASDDGPSVSRPRSPAGSGGTAGGGSGGSTTVNPPGTTVAPPASVGASPLRRLTKREYANTVRDLLGTTVNVTNAFSADVLGKAGFTVGADVTPVEATQYQEAAEDLAAEATRDLNKLFACDGGEAACTDKFISDFGKRVYRRPLISEEKADLKALYTSVRTGGLDHANGVRVLLETMLQSPNFLYRGELGTAGDGKSPFRPLSTYEVASRLSYFLWQSMPDAELFADAETGALAKADVLEKHARRLLDSDRARAAIEEFGAGWLHLDYGDVVKDTKVFADFTPAAKTGMYREVTEFLVDTLLKGDDLSKLFTADYTWADAALAKIYGVPAPAGFEKVTLDPAQGRAGLLTQVAFLAKNAGPSASSPTRRGVTIREQLFCLEVPAPPPDLNPMPPTASTMLTVREQVEAHMKSPDCAPCHALFDPIGVAFESFDGIGRFRTMEAGKAVDTRGEIKGTDVDGPVAGVKELSGRLIRSADVRRCLTTQLFRFALGRREDKDKAVIDRLTPMGNAKWSARDLMVGLVKSEAFLYLPAN